MNPFASTTCRLFVLGLCAASRVQAAAAVERAAADAAVAEPTLTGEELALLARPGAAFAIVARLGDVDADGTTPVVVLGQGRVGDDGRASLQGIIPRPHGSRSEGAPLGIIPRPHGSRSEGSPLGIIPRPHGSRSEGSPLGIIPRPHGRSEGSPLGIIPRPHSAAGGQSAQPIAVLVQAVVFDGETISMSQPVSLLLEL